MHEAESGALDAWWLNPRKVRSPPRIVGVSAVGELADWDGATNMQTWQVAAILGRCMRLEVISFLNRLVKIGGIRERKKRIEVARGRKLHLFSLQLAFINGEDVWHSHCNY